MLLTCSLLLVNIFGIIYIFFIHSLNHDSIRRAGLNTSLCTFIISLLMWVFFDRSTPWIQFGYYNSSFGLLGLDGISLFFIILTALLTPLCLLTAWKSEFYEVKEYVIYLLLIELFLFLAFLATDLVVFFIFFESTLIPMFILIGFWGSRERKIKAAFYLFIYTLFGSILLMFAIMIIYLEVGNTSFLILSFNNISFEKQLLLWLFSYIAFSVKTPTFPFHIWLPEAHVEAPTSGSVILAGLLLKLGGYGFIKFLLPVFSEGTFYYLPLVYTLSCLSILYASLATLRQLDLKRIIAYSSIAHMNLGVLGIFSCNAQGIQGSLFLMIAHGVVSSAMFFMVGIIYDKYHTRLLDYYGGLVQVMPLFSIYLLIFCLANVGLPGTCNFIGELLCFIGILDINFFVTFIALIGTIISVLYTIFFYNRLVFGNIKVKYISVWQEMTKREHAIVLPLGILTFVFGIFPNFILDTTMCSILFLVECL